MQRYFLLISVCLGFFALGGCRPPLQLTPTWSPDQEQRYHFVSERDIAIHWDLAREGADGTTHVKERLEFGLAFRVKAVEPNGITQLEARCESSQVHRVRVNGQADPRTDAAEQLAGRSFSIRLDQQGRIVDANAFNELMKDIGKKPFSESTKQGRIKAPDMIWDIIACCYGLWDVLGQAPVAGGKRSLTWTSRLPVPTPWVSRKARDVTYTLDRLEKTPEGQVAVITSTQVLSPERAPRSWPIPYAGKMRQSGTFGFLMGHKIHSLSGTGTHCFNLDTGQSESYEHQYRLKSQAFIPMNFSTGVQVTIEQTLKMTALDSDGPFGKDP